MLRKLVEFGAQGIGLCRTEHMFFEADRIAAIREMIVSKTSEQREIALNKILPMQRSDFEGLYKVMSGYPVVIRLLDPPLHEFLPHDDEEISALAKDMNMSFDELKSIVVNLHEFNPMMGHRGCRLSITYPEIAVMQTKAIIQAAINVKKEGYKVKPEIMVPLVGEVKELKYVKNIITETADKLIKESGLDIKYYVGTMIEIPRACLVADEIAKEAEFFSFGTNDLTQLTYGFSRDDAGKFLKFYYDKKIFEFDPFQKVDQIGVGKLMKMAIQDAKRTRPSIELGICGEHRRKSTNNRILPQYRINICIMLTIPCTNSTFSSSTSSSKRKAWEINKKIINVKIKLPFLVKKDYKSIDKVKNGDIIQTCCESNRLYLKGVYCSWHGKTVRIFAMTTQMVIPRMGMSMTETTTALVM